MVIGLLTLAAIPTTIGVAQGISHQDKEKEEKDDERRMAKFYIEARCEGDDEGGAVTAASGKRTTGRKKIEDEVNRRRVVVRDGKVYISSSSASSSSYPVCAFYIAYPDEDRKPAVRGLVSQVSDDPPMLNWIYIDKDTMEVKYGNRTQSRPHLVGPWDWTEEHERGLTLEGWEGFMAVEVPRDGVVDPAESEGGERWQLYFDRDDDGLKGYVGKRRRKIEVTLERIMV